MTNFNQQSVNAVAARWAEIVWAVSWQFCILGLIVVMVHWSLRRAAPNWRYWLWQILAIKLLLMPFWTATAPWKWPSSDSKVEAITELPRRKTPAVAIPANLPKPSESSPRPSAVATHESIQTSKAAKSLLPVAQQGTEQKLTGQPATQSQGVAAFSQHALTGKPEPRRELRDQTKTAGSPAMKPLLDQGRAEAPRISVAPPQQSINPATGPEASAISASAVATLMTALVKMTGLTWQSWLMLAWAGGVLTLASRIIWQGLSLSRRLRKTAPGDPDLVERVRAAAAKLRMTRIPEVRVIDLDVSPFVCGLWWPRLIVPDGLAQSFTAEQLDLVLLHELAHVRRQDLIWGWIPEIGKILFFFHPIVHFLCAQVRFERELACDQLAMVSSGRDAATYADTLVRVVGQFSGSDSFQLAANSPTLANPMP